MPSTVSPQAYPLTQFCTLRVASPCSSPKDLLRLSSLFLVLISFDSSSLPRLQHVVESLRHDLRFARIHHIRHELKPGLVREHLDPRFSI